jgi:16S rRNA A1518/A1519 N6-dimethyltransferase RsmA/KsgA/DIM1 with predicted DNA glycosylase/AP lyase activity
MLDLIPSESLVCVDLGSGWGGMLSMLAKRYPQARIIGYEQSWIPFFWSKLTCRHPNIEIYCSDFLSVEYPKDAVLLCYLCPKGMRRIANGLRGQAAWLISHTFALPQNTPIALCTLSDVYKSPIYIYSLSPKED